MKKGFKKYLFACLLVGLFLPLTAQALGTKKEYKKALDVRILVDVSQKMKLHDPDGYRSSALELFIKLLPAKTTAGMWMYDGLVTELMPVSKTTLSWKALAQKSIKKIHSNGQLSNLEKAIAVATLDWVESDEKTSRHLVLLTDGLINVSGKKRAAEASRKRILNSQLKRLKEQGISVHAVGLSKKAEVSVLEELAAGTGGWYDRVKNISHLERTLFRVNRHLVQKNNIALDSNKFNIDDSVREFTAVIFREKKFANVQLDDPEGMDFGSSSNRDGVSWYRGKNYDIVSVKNPIEGWWQIVAPANPNSGILVTTNLEMVIDTIPKEIPSGHKTRIRGLMVEKGRLLSNRNFLDAIVLSVELKDKEGELYQYNMERDMITGGYYFADIGERLIPGVYELTITATSNTFERIETTLISVGEKLSPTVITVPAEFKQVLEDSGIRIPKDNLYEAKVLVEFEKDLEELKDKKKRSAEAAEEEAKKAAEEEQSEGLMASVVMTLINIILGVGAFFGFKLYRKKTAASDEALFSKLE